MMQVGSLFSGIGGIDLGLERAGMQVVWQAENDPYASKVLAKHWPDVPNLGDITEVDWDALRTLVSGWRSSYDTRVVDLVCGGFPCQDISFAGRGGGITPGSRSGLWTEYVRCLRALRPRWVLVENVPALLVRRPGMDVVAADLATLGYDLWWDCIPAAAVGAPHRRDRVWIVAHTGRDRLRVQPVAEHWRGSASLAVVNGTARHVAHADASGRNGRAGELGQGRRREPADGGQWAAEPGMGRVAHGVPARVDRLRCLGNSVVPQVAELIGRAIVQADLERAA